MNASRNKEKIMQTFWQDLRHGARMLMKEPGFTLIAVLTLALGTGATTAIFSVVDGVLLRPLPYFDADRVVTLWQRNNQSGAKENGASPANFFDWQSRSQAFAEMAAAEPYSLNLTGVDEPEAFRAWLVTAGFFQILGVGASHGRTFAQEEYKAGNERVVIISYGLWQRRFGADPNLIGRTLRLNGQQYTVLGVMPPEFQFPTGREMWAPRIATERDKVIRGSGYLPVIGRLKPGVTLAQAQQEMDGIAAQLAREYPQANGERGVTVVPLPEQLTGRVRPALLVLLGAVGMLLLIACANVASLLLARAAEREREFAVRAALGAARGRLARQLLTESLLLALLGGLVGILLAGWVSSAILSLSSGDLPRAGEVRIGGRVLAFAFVVSALTALIFGLAPALRFSRPDLNRQLREGGRGATGLVRQRLRQALVVSEVALALVLLVGAGLLMRSFARLLQVTPGFSTDRALALEVHIWGVARTPEQRAAFFEQTLDRIAALPGVRAAGAVTALPFHDSAIDPTVTFTIEGRPAPLPGQEPTAYLTVTTADYFNAMGIPLRRGRFYNRFDRQGTAPVALISETMVRRYWADEDPVGKKITARLFGQPINCEIIGIVGDVRHTGLDSDPRPELFRPHLQSPYGSMTYVVRTAADSLTLLPAVKKEIWAVNKNLPFTSTATVEQLVSRTLDQRRFTLLLLGSFAALALLLAAVGLYGLISFTTRQRTHEIGVRMALGAQARDITRLVVREGLLLALPGVAIGVAGAWALTRFLSGLLFGVSATDPVTFAALSTLLLVVALLACYIPARRAAKVDPMVALRYE
jgi:putative ABC transport system permease protein